MSRMFEDEIAVMADELADTKAQLRYTRALANWLFIMIGFMIIGVVAVAVAS